MFPDGLLEVLNVWCNCSLARQFLIVLRKTGLLIFLVAWYCSCAESQGFGEGTSEKL